ncbi:hypothetical protein N5C36_02695 [Shewanella xiamenensis]|uniref:hypothetical protein n=1 Tax=Shewanella xiamenensis TaxID=332186 RepID=UPI000DB66496|nr:hypothetical protein [Shewanella xiamenensis]PZP32179.1 MAG: hypothetical protein DI594_12300 [Shewanella oneidensis]MBW0295209.1 hypothetical protein [Shewanella xiamenensis]MCT8863576.1 hypothetical protein [Shewanella xiamenensis]MCT8876030.1 hypothetical protein [Shewanella xiamenensis]MDH1312999.1 hypothetical protein [Shewanella xiamenensis]
MTEKENNNWLSLVGMISELKKCDELGVVTASIAMGFIAIDTMASLAREENKPRATRSDFHGWVNRYLKGDPEQLYQYRGKDVYAARCAFLHSYSSDAELHEKDPNIIKYVYHDGGRHTYNPTIDANLVVIATRSFVYDIICAANDFMDECARDIKLRARVESRLDSILQTEPYPQ